MPKIIIVMGQSNTGKATAIKEAMIMRGLGAGYSE